MIVRCRSRISWLNKNKKGIKFQVKSFCDLEYFLIYTDMSRSTNTTDIATPPDKRINYTILYKACMRSECKISNILVLNFTGIKQHV